MDQPTQNAPQILLCRSCEELQHRFSDLFGRSLGLPRRCAVGTLKQALMNQSNCGFCEFLIKAYELAYDLKPGQSASEMQEQNEISLRIVGRLETDETSDTQILRTHETIEEPWYEKAGLIAETPPAPAIWVQFSDQSIIDDPLVLVSCKPRSLFDESLERDYSYSMPRERDPVLADSGSLDYNLIQNWINVCEELHTDSCGRSTIYQRQSLQLKLVDVLKREVVSAETNERYVALSYVRGPDASDDDTFRMPCENEVHGYGVPLPKLLPQTLEDAITFTKSMNVRYLWVDMLCINQEDSAEKRAQIEKMHLVYECAFLTIIAMDGSDIDSGLPGISRPMLRARQPKVETNFGSFMATYIYHIWNHQGCAPWDLRAWTLQELILSRRALIFDQKYLLFLCNSEFFHEALNFNTNVKRVPTNLGGAYFWDNGFGLALKEEEWDYLQYDSLVANYTQRQLSNEADILAACTGALNQITTHTGVSFVYGMPRRDLNHALLWKSYSEITVSRREGFPSWSWTGWKGRCETHYCLSEWASYNPLEDDPTRKSLIPGGTTRNTPEEHWVKRNPSAFITTPRIESVDRYEILQVSSSVARFRIAKVRSKGDKLSRLPDGTEQESTAVGDQWVLLDQKGNKLRNLVGEVSKFEETDYSFQIDPQVGSQVELESLECEVLFIKYFEWLRDTYDYNNWLDDMVGTLLIRRIDDHSATRFGSVYIRLEDWVNANPQPAVINLI